MLVNGRFRIDSVLGRGAMGSVYRAHDTELNRDVALKVIRRDDPSAELEERFRREGQITANLRHPGIVRVHELGQDGERSFLAYELIEGARTLDDVLREGDLRVGVTLITAAGEALGHAHAQGVVHRDVKPANVLVTPEGKAKVADFGLAAAGLSRLTKTGALIGTPLYMAPEQFVRTRGSVVGPQADVWSLGVILYELLTGQLPFDAPNLVELSAQITRTTPPPPRTLNPDVPWALSAVCVRALAKNPAQRYADGAAMALDLRRFRAGTSPNAPSSGTWGAALAGFLCGSLAVGIVAALALPGESTVAESSQAATPDAAPVAVQASPWQLRVGDRRRTLFSWEFQRTGGGQFMRRETQFEFDEEIESIDGSQVTVVMTVVAFRLHATGLVSLRYDSHLPSDGPGHLEALSAIQGAKLVLHYSTNTGVCSLVDGLTRVRDAVGRSVPELLGVASEILASFDDRVFARQMTTLLQCTPPHSGSAWSRDVSVWTNARRRFGAEVDYVRGGGGEVVGDASRFSVDPNPPPRALPATARFVIQGRFTDRLVASSLKLDFDMHQDEVDYEGRFLISYRELIADQPGW